MNPSHPNPTADAFRDLMSKIHRDAARCALADLEADRPWPGTRDERGAAEDLAVECAAELGLSPETGLGPATDFWLRCYDRVSEALRVPAAAVAAGDRVRVHSGQHAGRLATVLPSRAGDAPSIELDSRTPGEATTGHGLIVRWTDLPQWAAWA